ncbi:MAG: DUF3179 domain-containing (seleno)protein, partial [Pseudomonadota bacterium]
MIRTLAALTLGAMLAAPALADVPSRWERAWPDTDFTKISINPAEIFSGGPPKDGIPAVTGPTLKPIAEETEIDDREPVMSVAIEGHPARAYPVRYLMWHEIVNDRIGNVPVAVTFCPLCNSGLVFDLRLDGRELELGVSGMLRHSDMIMYDRQTETLWQQFEGRGIIGTHAGAKLKMIPIRLEAFQTFQDE